MTNQPFPAVDITGQWGRLNDSIVALVDYIPDDKLEWSPREDLWNFRGILVHTAMTRHGWLGSAVKDGGPSMDEPGAVGEFIRRAQSKEEIKRELVQSWERVERWLAKDGNLATVYVGSRDGQEYSYSGHWIAFHLLEHDIHHRSDIFHYLALLNIEHPEVGTP